MQVDRLVIAGGAQQRDEALTLAEGVDADKMAAFGKEANRMQELLDLVAVGRVAENRQPEGRLGDEQIAALRLEAGAGRVGAALIVARDHDAAAAIVDYRLGAAEDVAGRRQADRYIADRQLLAIAGRLHRPAGALAIALAHDRDRLGGGEHAVMAGPGMVAVAVRDDRALHRLHRVDMKATGLAIKPGRGRADPALRRRNGHDADIGSSFDARQRPRDAFERLPFGSDADRQLDTGRPDHQPGAEQVAEEHRAALAAADQEAEQPGRRDAADRGPERVEDRDRQGPHLEREAFADRQIGRAGRRRG